MHSGAQALCTDVLDAHGLHDGTDCTAGDNTGTFGSGLQHNSASAEDADDIVGDGVAQQGNLDHVLLSISDALQNSLRNFGSLAQAVTDSTLTVANNDQSGEFHNTSALDGLGNTVDRYDTLLQIQS